MENTEIQKDKIVEGISRLEMLVSIFRDMDDVELRLIAGIYRMKSLPVGVDSDEFYAEPEKYLPTFDQWPVTEVSNILMFKHSGFTGSHGVGQWFFNPRVSLKAGVLVFIMAQPKGFLRAIIKPEHVQKVMVRGIPINPFPHHTQNGSNYGLVFPYGKDGLRFSGNAWEKNDILRNWMNSDIGNDEENK